MKRPFWNIFIIGLSASILTSCSFFDRAVYYEIEVWTGKYAIVKLKSGPSTMHVKFNGQVLEIGKVTANYNEPVTIMENEGLLYVVKIFCKLKDGSTTAACWDFKFFKQEGNHFKEIQASEFPRRIAVANFHSAIHGQQLNKDGEVINDYRKIERDRDLSDPKFRSSITAHLWRHLETGDRYWDIIRDLIMDEEFVRSYAEKYNPVRLKMEKPKKLSKSEAGF